MKKFHWQVWAGCLLNLLTKNHTVVLEVMPQASKDGLNKGPCISCSIGSTSTHQGSVNMTPLASLVQGANQRKTIGDEHGRLLGQNAIPCDQLEGAKVHHKLVHGFALLQLTSTRVLP